MQERDTYLVKIDWSLRYPRNNDDKVSNTWQCFNGVKIKKK